MDIICPLRGYWTLKAGDYYYCNNKDCGNVVHKDALLFHAVYRCSGAAIGVIRRAR